MKEEKRSEIVISLINKMFEFAGEDLRYHDLNDIKKDFPWYYKYEMETSDFYKWTHWGEEYIEEKLECSSEIAKSEMGFFSLNYGLKIKR